ncbi:FHA domain-containing protein [Pseudonocardia endophytica]|uniref:FHA domain-containing protein n=1 Tax=Pseudonocardia endophytica TaxID=401976 RepID=A0A4R1HFS6_PSEEN|nr:FHA domain-containing protein [Pseudonocardia endophytica]TCK20987.1 FHA domain-containing protein [Pseudonocardia endophytica]
MTTELSCPAGHRSSETGWCDVCGRPLTGHDPVPATCRVCATPLACRFCDECGADDALPAPTARIAPDPAWFAHVLRRAGDRVGWREPPRTLPWRARLEHRRIVVGRRTARSVPDVDLTGDAGVSARHAVLACDDDGGWSVVDLGSSNGTAVGTYDAVPAHRPVPVPPGTVIRLGLWTSVLVEPVR